MFRQLAIGCCISGAMFIWGCSKSDAPAVDIKPSAAVEAPQDQLTPVSRVDDPSADVGSPLQSPSQQSSIQPPMVIPSISLSGSPQSPVETSPSNSSTKVATPADVSRRALLEAMKPVQIMLGSWRGTTQKEAGDFKALDEPEWVWDFQSNREQPAMVMKSAKSPYFREARLTYLTESNKFQLSAIDPEGNIREFEGKFAAPVEEFQGDDQKMHIKYKLQLQQTNGTTPRDTWQVTFNQQENHRYLVELARQSGSNFIRFDTIATQRQGTSFAKSDASYGERECIISGGLGTTQVSYMGKSYWVCCSGCQAAFNEDPQSWIAEYQAKQAAKEGS